MNRLTAEEHARLGGLTDRVDCARVRLHRDPGRLRALVLWVTRGRAVTLELTHCGQFQRWGAPRYFIRGAAAQLQDLMHRAGLGRSPYAYRLEEGKPFDAYGMEQQGQIVEDSFRGNSEALAVSPYRPRDPASGLASGQEAPSA